MYIQYIHTIYTRNKLKRFLEKLGARLTKMSKKQAEYIGVPAEGPYKPDHYRY